MLDNHEQTYRKKKNILPLEKGDLKQIIKRDLINDIDKDSIKNYVIFDDIKSNKTKEKKQWEVLFVSCPLSENIHEWLKFLQNFQMK